MKLSHADMCCSDEDVHKCGRCQIEFSTLEAFIQHKLQQSCRRVDAREASSEDASQEVRTGMMRGFISSYYNKQQRQENWMVISAFWQVTAANESSSEVKTAAGAASDEPVKNSNGGSTLGL